MTLVDRRTSCVMAWAAAPQREAETLQALIDKGRQAAFYYSDLFATYRQLVYSPGHYTPMPNKSETYRVEGDNAEIRHYLARFARRSRCFSRCLKAMQRALKLFVYLWNARQLYRQRFPNYPAYLVDFV